MRAGPGGEAARALLEAPRRTLRTCQRTLENCSENLQTLGQLLQQSACRDFVVSPGFPSLQANPCTPFLPASHTIHALAAAHCATGGCQTMPPVGLA